MPIIIEKNIVAYEQITGSVFPEHNPTNITRPQPKKDHHHA